MLAALQVSLCKPLLRPKKSCWRARNANKGPWKKDLSCAREKHAERQSSTNRSKRKATSEFTLLSFLSSSCPLVLFFFFLAVLDVQLSRPLLLFKPAANRSSNSTMCVCAWVCFRYTCTSPSYLSASQSLFVVVGFLPFSVTEQSKRVLPVYQPQCGENTEAERSTHPPALRQ